MINQDTMSAIKLLESQSGWSFDFDPWQARTFLLPYITDNTYTDENGINKERDFLYHAMDTLYKHNVTNYRITYKSDGFRVRIHVPMNEDIFNLYRVLSEVNLSGEKLIHTGGYVWLSKHLYKVDDFSSMKKVPDLYHFFEINFV